MPTLIYGGYKVRYSRLMDEIPRQQLSTDVVVSHEFRSEYNEWLSRFFGLHQPEQCLVSDYTKEVFVGKRTLRRLHDVAKENARYPMEKVICL